MTDVCFYFQVHQPWRINEYSVFDIGSNGTYFHDQQNREIMEKVAEKCYLPANQVMLDLLNQYDNFKISYSITGTALEQFEEYAPEVLDSFHALNDTGQVSFLNETYYHSLSYLNDHDEFKEQVRMHQQAMDDYFGQSSRILRNTELIYNDDFAPLAAELGYDGVLAEGWDEILQGRKPGYVYTDPGENVKLLLKNYQLSDDIAFRFSNQSWESWPLTAEKFADWVWPIEGDVVNLFMDYETFGEHQWEDTGIFDFLRSLPGELMNYDVDFVYPEDLLDHEAHDELPFHRTVSWADKERDISAWLGNDMQESAQQSLYDLKEAVFETQNTDLIEKWRRLSTSDHFYYMCTKWFEDGDVHAYFNPHDSPYDCNMAFMNILQDLSQQVGASQ
jgi:alpha-amylase